VQPVRDEDGNRLVLRKESGDTALVYDPDTGDERHVERSTLTPIEVSPLEAAAEAALDDEVRDLVLAIPNERALGLLVTLADRGPLSVRTLLAETTFCESDLSGLLASLTAAGLLSEQTDAHQRHYTVTERGRRALDHLRYRD
jgi:hypothetical protein